MRIESTLVITCDDPDALLAAIQSVIAGQTRAIKVEQVIAGHRNTYETLPKARDALGALLAANIADTPRRP